MVECTGGHAACKMEFRLSIAQMNDANRRAESYDIEKAPYGLPSYPYVWKFHALSKSIRLEMGMTDEAAPRRVIAMFTFQPLAPPNGVGVLVHVAVWMVDPTTDLKASSWAAVHSGNTNWHLTAITHFKGSLLNVPGGDYIVMPPELPKEA